jgi:exosortase/archaeosortase family protein
MTGLVVVYRFVALAALYGLFYVWDWMPLRVLLRDVIGWLVRVSRYDAISLVHEESPALRVEGCVHYYTAECTYLAPLLAILPFVWDFETRWKHNILRLIVALLAVLSINFLRCWFAVVLDVQGMSRIWAHDLPNYAVSIILIGVPVLAAARRDRCAGWQISTGRRGLVDHA